MYMYNYQKAFYLIKILYWNLMFYALFPLGQHTEQQMEMVTSSADIG